MGLAGLMLALFVVLSVSMTLYGLRRYARARRAERAREAAAAARWLADVERSPRDAEVPRPGRRPSPTVVVADQTRCEPKAADESNDAAGAAEVAQPTRSVQADMDAFFGHKPGRTVT